jgi:hypothetical protein
VSDTDPVRRAQELKEANTVRLRAYPNVTGVGVGFKEVGGVRTDTVAVRVYVARKVPVAELASEDVLPREVDGVPVDVIEGRWVVHDVADHRVRHDPMIGGISVGNIVLGGSGTIGGSVFDNRSQEDMILSNWHVLCGRTDCAIGETVVQPGTGGGDTGTAADIVARLHRAALTDEVDCAIARLSGHRFLLRDLLEVGPLGGVAEAVLGAVVRKSGRTTGATTATVTDISADVDVNGYPEGTHSFHHQLIIEGNNASLPGDSGSLWVDDDNNAIGLNFAGSDGGQAIANRINTVLTELDINLTRGVTQQALIATMSTTMH